MSSVSAPSPQNTATANRTALILIVSLFFAWGVANSLNDILIPQFKKAFILTDLQTGLVQSAFYGGYFLLAMPAAMFSRRFGYKAAMLCGLIVFGVGALLFFPAAEQHQYAYFLGALLVIASGLAFLETSANPMVASLGDVKGAEHRLNFAQAFNPLGVLFGVLLGRLFILSDAQLAPSQMAHAVVGPYVGIAAGVLALVALIAAVRFPSSATVRSISEVDGNCGFLPLFRKPRFLLGVVAQFFYVGAQVGVWSFTIRYTQHAVPAISITHAADILFGSQFLFMVGRFMGTALMGKIAAEKLMAVYAACAVALTLTAALFGGWIGVIALMATSFFMSIMFPTIFAGALRDLGSLTKSGSSFLVMAIIGGAVAPPIMGCLSGIWSIQYAMIVPSASFVVICVFALTNGRAKAACGGSQR